METLRKRRPASRVHSGIFGIAGGLAWIPLALLGCAGPPDPPPSIYDDPALAAQLDENDGIEAAEPRFQGWVHGRETFYWILEGAPETAMRVYRLCSPDAGRCRPIDHPLIADRLPGEDGYSPYGQVYAVEVPDGWNDQLASFDEVNTYLDGEGASARSTSELINCPIAGSGGGIDLGDGVIASAERTVYVRGLAARCFDFSATRENRAVLPSGELFVRHVYVLAREGETEPLIESVRGVDLNGDGDQLDSNNIFGVDLADSDYTPLWKMVAVTVPSGLASIDSTPAYTQATDMFDIAPDYTITPRTDRIVSHEITDVLINCPLQSGPGQL